MCLDTITQRFSPNKKVRFAYKGLESRPDGLAFPCNSHNGEYLIDMGKWLKAECPELETARANDDGEIEEYKGGFHCYTSSSPLHRFGDKLVRVKIRGLICTGKQLGSNVIVAKEMLVPRRKKRKRA